MQTCTRTHWQPGRAQGQPQQHAQVCEALCAPMKTVAKDARVSLVECTAARVSSPTCTQRPVWPCVHPPMPLSHKPPVLRPPSALCAARPWCVLCCAVLCSVRVHIVLQFITGASRGIGLAIALRAARDGANIVIAAKTTEPQATLEVCKVYCGRIDFSKLLVWNRERSTLLLKVLWGSDKCV